MRNINVCKRRNEFVLHIRAGHSLFPLVFFLSISSKPGLGWHWRDNEEMVPAHRGPDILMGYMTKVYTK